MVVLSGKYTHGMDLKTTNFAELPVRVGGDLQPGGDPGAEFGHVGDDAIQVARRLHFHEAGKRRVQGFAGGTCRRQSSEQQH